MHFTVHQYQELRKQGTTMGEFFQQQMEQIWIDPFGALRFGEYYWLDADQGAEYGVAVKY